MKTKHFALLGLAAAVAFAPAAFATQLNYAFSFNGDGISASGVIKVGQQSANSSSPRGYEITGISGTFADTNVDVSGAITGLYTPVSYVNNPLDLGFAHTTGGLSYDDLFYPAGDSPAVCFKLVDGVPTLTYPFHGGVFDIYGVAFNVAGGYTAELWSNGEIPGSGLVYASGLADATGLVDNPNTGPESSVPPGRFGTLIVRAVPEPGVLPLFGIGLFGLGALYARRRRNTLSRRSI